MDETHPLSFPIVVCSLDKKNDSFHPCEKAEELLGPKVPYHSTIGALMYLSNCTRTNIAFLVNLLARYRSALTKIHWNGIKHILCYLCETTDIDLFYSKESKAWICDVGYLSNPHKCISQTGCVLNCNGTSISWRFVKQTILATSSNHLGVLAIHEASRECMWLRSMIQHIQESCGLSFIKDSPKKLFEDNVTCIAQIKGGLYQRRYK